MGNQRASVVLDGVVAECDEAIARAEKLEAERDDLRDQVRVSCEQFDALVEDHAVLRAEVVRLRLVREAVAASLVGGRSLQREFLDREIGELDIWPAMADEGQS